MVIKLNLLFKNKTKYTKETYKKFVEFHSKKYNFQYTLFNVIIIALILFCMILQVTYKYYSLAIFTCIIFTCFCLYRYFHPISVVAKELKGETISEEKTFTFKFYEKYFKVFDKLDNSNVNYNELRKIFETKNFFYLYLDKTHAFIISKENFSIGTPTDFSKFIKKKCFLKYKKVK